MKMNKSIKATRTALVLGFCLAGASFGVIGCQNTAEGVGADAQKDTAAVGNAAAKTGEAMKDTADKAAMATKDAADKTAMAAKNTADKAGMAAEHGTRNAADATTLTPKVKAAIIANETLNNVKNLVNVDSRDTKVYLKGHVISNDQKKLAGEVAAKAVKDARSSDTVVNQLTVENH